MNPLATKRATATYIPQEGSSHVIGSSSYSSWRMGASGARRQSPILAGKNEKKKDLFVGNPAWSFALTACSQGRNTGCNIGVWGQIAIRSRSNTSLRALCNLQYLWGNTSIRVVYSWRTNCFVFYLHVPITSWRTYCWWTMTSMLLILRNLPPTYDAEKYHDETPKSPISVAHIQLS